MAMIEVMPGTIKEATPKLPAKMDIPREDTHGHAGSYGTSPMKPIGQGHEGEDLEKAH